MLSAAPLGALVVVVPAVNQVLGLLLLVGMVLFAVYFWRAFAREPAADRLGRAARLRDTEA